MNTLWLEIWTEQDDFCMYVATDEDEQELRFAGQAQALVAQFETIYTILENTQTTRVDELEAAINRLSEQLLVPFAEQLRQCALVRVIVYEDLIRCAVDLLRFDGQYLFLQRPICYQIDEGEGEDAPELELASALLLADLTADPEEACREVAKLFAEAQYAEIGTDALGLVKAAADQVDVLVISAHGDLDADNAGVLWLGETKLSAKQIEKLEAWIVYFDSCQQGVNMSYLQALQEESDVQYYLAPIISNDAGDSSTKTLVWFFSGLHQHKDPFRGLFETRKRLYQYYMDEKRLNLVTSLNKAFPFRLYEFVDSTEEE